MTNEMQTITWKKTFRFAIAVPLLLIGCGSPDQPELGAVTGKVTLNDAPLSHVEVSFVPEVGRPSYGETDNDGKYELIYIRDTKGAKIGKHKITVHSGKVDNSQLKPVEIEAGPNVINIQCAPSSGKNASAREGDDT